MVHQAMLARGVLLHYRVSRVLHCSCSGRGRVGDGKCTDGQVFCEYLAKSPLNRDGANLWPIHFRKWYKATTGHDSRD